MFHSPPRTMVQTRSGLRRERELQGLEEYDGSQVDGNFSKQQLHTETEKPEELHNQRSEKQKTTEPCRTGRAKSRTSSASSAARRARLELEAAEAKAKIQIELIDKRLAADLADIVEDGISESAHSRVAKWVEQSQPELNTQPASEYGHDTGALCPPTLPAGTEGTVHLLASALQNLTSTSMQNPPNLLSRICTPSDLPLFSGDPMEWLQFREAYKESTQLCKLSAKENLWRLRKSLRGPALEAVSALLISASSPDVIMSTLELQFGNPDIILSKIMLDVRKMQPVSQEYHKDIVSFSVKVRNCVTAISVIGREEYLVATNVITSILSKLPTILLSKWADYCYPIINEGERPTLNTLSEFLNKEAVKVGSMALLNAPLDYNYSGRKYSEPKRVERSHTVLFHEDCVNKKCNYCHTSLHKLTDCKKFLKSRCRDRWFYVKRHGLCFKCLLSRHGRNTCPAALCDIDKCGLEHHRLLHYDFKKLNNKQQLHEGRDSSELQVQNQQTSEGQEQPESVTHINANTNCKVLLKVVRVNLNGPNGNITAYALLDDGSTVSLISADLTSRLGLRGRRDTIRVCGAWENNELVCQADVVSLQLFTCEGNTYALEARSVKELHLPEQYYCYVDCNNYSHLTDLHLNLCKGNVKPEILIGQDNYHLLMPLDTRVGKVSEPCATLTPLGWCIHGRVPVASSRRHSTLLIKQDVQEPRDDDDLMLQQLHEEVRKSFTIESMGISGKLRQNADDIRALEHLENTATLIDNRWHVGLPWRDDNCEMPDSKPSALRRLRGVEKKMSMNDQYAQRYRDRIKHLFDNDFAEEVTNENESSNTWYLPHFGVDNPNKKKLRLVFDAAAKTKGFSLNDFLLKGPDLLRSLYGIMLRFRELKVAIAGDIKDMFLRVKILHKDQDALRFLWRDDVNSPVKTYKMTSLIFGANSSPFIAQFVKNKNALRFSLTMPSAVEAITKQHYMDDYLDSQQDEVTCIKLAKDVSKIHNDGGFQICNWLSNSNEVLNNLPTELLPAYVTSCTRVLGHQLYGERTLGLLWYPKDDTLGFDVSFKRIPSDLLDGKRPTKREALRLIMSVFDVYGFLSPFTINGKIILQLTWKSNIGWDDVLNDDIYEKWIKWLTVLKSIGNIRIPRCYQTVPNFTTLSNLSVRPLESIDDSVSYDNLQLHIFSDASTQAMCCVAFWRWTHMNKVRVAFVSSKCRVAPVKPMTVPRLELQAALMAARLADTIEKEHRIKAKGRIFWCDSTTVLQWIRNNKRDYKVFVAHRLGEIDELTNVNEWRFIHTSMNVADIATRESYDVSVFQKEWFTGPKFMYCDENSWPADIDIPESDGTKDYKVECITIIQDMVKDNLPIPDPCRFSSWLRLMRSTAVMLKFIDKCRKRKLTSDCELMARAENMLIKYSQAQSFGQEVSEIKSNIYVNSNSRLLTLSPYLDEDGILRVQGRIEAAADVSLDLKRPVILDGKHEITRLLVMYHHIKAGHGNQEMVVNELKQKYWILKLRPAVKYVASKCMYCRIKKAKPEIPKMGDLPAGRVAHHHRPFTHCGVDLFGPMEVSVARHREKRYGVLFTCLTIRAIHIEVVNSLTTDSLLMALRRMASRRGWPKYLYSDNGTNMRGTDTEMKKSIQELDNEKLEGTAANYGTQWSFIPPASPHWGGAWERLIRSIKTTLKVILTERAPKEETFITLLAEVENIVNSRPLSHVSVENGSKESLTPNHFLLGTSSNLPMLGVFDDSDTYLRKQWRVSQALADMFWKRWVREILPAMNPRKKWNVDQVHPLAEGDLVFIVDPDAPRGTWPRGIIQEVFPGKDGRVRVVNVRTATGYMKRSVARVARIPME